MLDFFKFFRHSNDAPDRIDHNIEQIPVIGRLPIILLTIIIIALYYKRSVRLNYVMVIERELDGVWSLLEKLWICMLLKPIDLMKLLLPINSCYSWCTQSSQSPRIMWIKNIGYRHDMASPRQILCPQNYIYF